MYTVKVRQANGVRKDEFYNFKLAYDFYRTTQLFKDIVYAKLYMNDVLLEKYTKE